MRLRWPVPFWLFSAMLLAQSDNASISGFIRDPSGSVVPNARVIVRNEATAFERRTATGNNGYYVVTPLPPGFYTVSAEAPGFKRSDKTGNKLDPNIASMVDLQLQVGDTSERIEVVASLNRVQSETATVGKLISREQIDLIGLNGRDPLYLAMLKPGVSGAAMNAFSFAYVDSGRFNYNGARWEDSVTIFDGAPATRTRSSGWTTIGGVQVGAVQEVQVLTANYAAEYGRSAGGQLRVVSKSGTRNFHGDLSEYFRNPVMNANSWSRNRIIGNTDLSGKPAPFRYNQFGYTFSGPLFIPNKLNRDRTKVFFLWAQEWSRYRTEGSTSITVPTELMRVGNFSELAGPNSFFGKAVTIKDPTGQPYPGNIIPRSQTSPTGLALLRAYPLPTPGYSLGANNFFQVQPDRQNQRKDALSLDLIPATSHQLRFRMQHSRFDNWASFRNGTDRNPLIQLFTGVTLSLNYIWTVSPTFVGETLVTASRDRVRQGIQPGNNRYRRSTYGIDYPYLFPTQKQVFDKIPTIQIQDFATVDGGNTPNSSAGPIYSLSNNFTKVIGSHMFKFGFTFERSGENDFEQINVTGVPGGTNNQNGRFVFDNLRAGAATTGLAIANTALGLYSSYAELGSVSYTPYRAHTYEWFAQDSWKITPKLRFEYGLRHTILQPYYSLWRNMVVFDPRAYDPARAVTLDSNTGFVLSGDQYNGLVIPGEGWPKAAKGRVPIADTGAFDRLFRGYPKQYSDIHGKDLQPRLGVAYALTPKTAIRSGLGYYETRTGVSDSIFLGGNPPLVPSVSTTNGVADNPAGTGKSLAFPLIVTTWDRILKNPGAWNWNLTVERELPFKSVLEIAYVGRHGLHSQREGNINQLLPGTIQANPGVHPDFLRPYKGFGPIRVGNTDASSRYKGLQIGLTRRFTNGLSYGLAYTYSKSMDDASSYRSILPNAFDGHALWGPSDFDSRHVAIFNWVYELPFLKRQSGVAGKVLGGWQITGVMQFQTGGPGSIATGDDFAGVGIGSGAQLWVRNGDPVLSRGERRFSTSAADQNYWFQTANPDGSRIFTPPPAGTFTDQKNRNLTYRPGFQNWNLSLYKVFRVNERHSFEFRSESYNWLNHPNWGPVDRNPRSATFGKVSSKSSERNLQLSLRYRF